MYSSNLKWPAAQKHCSQNGRKGFSYANSCCKCCLLSYLSQCDQCGQQKQTSPANHKQPVSYINYTGHRLQWNTVTASMSTQRLLCSTSTNTCMHKLVELQSKFMFVKKSLSSVIIQTIMY